MFTWVHCGIAKGARMMAPKQGLCMSDTTDFKKGGIGICSCLMCACWCVFLCVRVLICTGRKHVFLADRA